MSQNALSDQPYRLISLTADLYDLVWFLKICENPSPAIASRSGEAGGCVVCG
jgi:hypothetical protein